MSYSHDFEMRLHALGIPVTREALEYFGEYLDCTLATKDAQIQRLMDEIAVVQERLARCQEGGNQR